MDQNSYSPTPENPPPMPSATPGSGYGYPAPGGYAMPPPAPQAQKTRSGIPFKVALLAAALALLVLVGIFAVGIFQLGSSFQSLFTVSAYSNNPPSGTFSVISVVGTIQNASGDSLGISDPSYHHSATISYINRLAEDDGNAGILLYMNTGGGTVFESDEVYLALMDYKEETGRPIWAYMSTTCASGGYYICAAADYIMANRNTTTGSIGVYIALTDTSELYDKLGIETVLVKSGPNKGVGISGVPITNEQSAIYQSIVDEHYEQFIQIVADGRGMNLSTVRTLADGRVYTGRQALENGLVDELTDWDTALEDFEEYTGASVFYTNFSRRTTIGSMLGSIFGSLPQGETEALISMAEKYPVGVPMMMYDPATSWNG